MTSESKLWHCEKCLAVLARDDNNFRVKIEMITTQNISVEYLKISATCKKCGHAQEKFGASAIQRENEKKEYLTMKIGHDLLLMNLQRELTNSPLIELGVLDKKEWEDIIGLGEN